MASTLPRLHRAAKRGEKGKLKQFLTAGDDVNTRDDDGCSALLWSVISGHLKCVEILLAAGADPSACDNAEFFPLYAAAQHSNIPIAKALIQANANLNAIIDLPNSGTALYKAVSLRDKPMIKVLLDAGCDTSIAAPGAHHPITLASFYGHFDTITMLLDGGADISAMSSLGSTALLIGAQQGRCDVVKLLLERGADVNQQEHPAGRTALHMAAQLGFDELINILVAAGADVHLVDSDVYTPLRAACYHGHAKCAYALLRAGANVSARDKDGLSPLHVAASQGHTDVIEVLLEAGGQADVNCLDDLKRTPLGLAASFADARAVNLVLDAGADINQLDGTGATALFKASDVEIVKALLDRGANAKDLDKDGRTVLHFAGYLGASAGVICALFKAGAVPTLKDIRRKTAADLARQEGHEDAAKLLDLLAAKHRSTNST